MFQIPITVYFRRETHLSREERKLELYHWLVFDETKGSQQNSIDINIQKNAAKVLGIPAVPYRKQILPPPEKDPEE